MSGSEGSTHWYGLIAALVGFVALVVWLRRSARTGPTGGRRWAVIGAWSAGLIALALFGNGSYVTNMATALAPQQVPAPVQPAQVAAAVRTATSPEFVRYWAALRGEPLRFDPAELAPRIDVELVSYAAARQAGVQITPSPPDNAPLVLFRYHDASNVVAASFDVGRPARNQRYAFAQDLANQILEELLRLEALRAARSDEDRVRQLAQLREHGVPQMAEWIARELRRQRAAGASPEVTAAIDETLALVQRYIDDPTMRALPADRRVALP